MRNWILYLCGIHEINDEPIRVGSRIKTKHGMGTVTGGCLMVKLDKSPEEKRSHQNDMSWTFNINKEI